MELVRRIIVNLAHNLESERDPSEWSSLAVDEFLQRNLATQIVRNSTLVQRLTTLSRLKLDDGITQATIFTIIHSL